MKNAAKRPTVAHGEIRLGVFTKREAALDISSGIRHLHSTALSEKDPGAKATLSHKSTHTIPKYSWELTEKAKTVYISSSTDRSRAIKKAVTDAGLLSKRDLREKTEGVIEELITNAIYHAYHTAGKEKYTRSKAVQLTEKEKIKLSYQKGPGGIFISIQDKGGNLRFEKFAASLARCYGHASEQIENKESGAGLGLYLIFEATTHIKIVSRPGVSTTISCWIAEKGSFEPNNFSFNFYVVKGRKNGS